MTTLEIILAVILYIFIGIWTVYKDYKSNIDQWEQDWDLYTAGSVIVILITIIIHPFYILWMFIKKVIIDKW